MLPLPEPVHGGSLHALRPLLNFSDDDYVLSVGWLFEALHPRGPYPVLNAVGGEGTAKTTLAKILRGLIDPAALETRAPPREERDLAIAANNGHVIVYDNLSSIPPWLSDALCRIATGGGYATRQLYSDTDEVLLSVQRPIILTSIDNVIERGDLADRSMNPVLEQIADDRRRTEAHMKVAFEASHPGILGALLDAVSLGLRRLPHVRLERLPRMADFALWATACETACWAEGTFMRAYTAERAVATNSVIEADPIATSVQNFLAERTVWSGTAGALLAALNKIAGEAATNKGWPKTPHAMAGRLRRATTVLRGAEIKVTSPARTDKKRTWLLEQVGKTPPTSPTSPNASENNDLGEITSAASPTELPMPPNQGDLLFCPGAYQARHRPA